MFDKALDFLFIVFLGVIISALLLAWVDDSVSDNQRIAQEAQTIQEQYIAPADQALIEMMEKD